MVKRVRDEWFDLARDTLISDGIDAVSVQGMSQKLGVSRGGFYGYFGARGDLLARLLQDWRQTNTDALRRIAAPQRTDGATQFNELVQMWLEDDGYRPAYDAAVRDWGRRSSDVARIVRRVDSERVRLITRIFRNLGFPADEALVRARITYYHQVGYYALMVHETRSSRRKLIPLYKLALAGSRLPR
jgi:AcrR family transcriptional regulator